MLPYLNFSLFPQIVQYAWKKWHFINNKLLNSNDLEIITFNKIIETIYSLELNIFFQKKFFKVSENQNTELNLQHVVLISEVLLGLICNLFILFSKVDNFQFNYWFITSFFLCNSLLNLDYKISCLRNYRFFKETNSIAPNS
jgi:hypothetical protein